MQIIDFNRSYILWHTKKDDSYGRFNIVCQLIIGKKEYFLGSGVMACNMYSASDLIIYPSYRYEAVFSLEEHHIFRTATTNVILEQSSGLNSERFKSLEIHKMEKEYTFIGQLNDRVIMGESFIACMEIAIAGINATAYFPVKHINYSSQYEKMQAETGPVILPDISCGHFDSAKDIALYYIAFNSFTKVDMLITSRENRFTSSERAYTNQTKIQLFQSVS